MTTFLLYYHSGLCEVLISTWLILYSVLVLVHVVSSIYFYTTAVDTIRAITGTNNVFEEFQVVLSPHLPYDSPKYILLMLVGLSGMLFFMIFPALVLVVLLLVLFSPGVWFIYRQRQKNLRLQQAIRMIVREE